MPRPTKAQRLADYLTAVGYQPRPDMRTHRFIHVFQEGRVEGNNFHPRLREDGRPRFYFVGRSGALRYGPMVSQTISLHRVADRIVN